MRMPTSHLKEAVAIKKKKGRPSPSACPQPQKKKCQCLFHFLKKDVRAHRKTPKIYKEAVVYMEIAGGGMYGEVVGESM
jgi:hypothetical protein